MDAEYLAWEALYLLAQNSRIPVDIRDICKRRANLLAAKLGYSILG